MTNAPPQADESGDTAALFKDKKKIPTANQNIYPPETDGQSKCGEYRHRENGMRFGKDPKFKYQEISGRGTPPCFDQSNKIHACWLDWLIPFLSIGSSRT